MQKVIKPDPECFTLDSEDDEPGPSTSKGFDSGINFMDNDDDYGIKNYLFAPKKCSFNNNTFLFSINRMTIVKKKFSGFRFIFSYSTVIPTI